MYMLIRTLIIIKCLFVKTSVYLFLAELQGTTQIIFTQFFSCIFGNTFKQTYTAHAERQVTAGSHPSVIVESPSVMKCAIYQYGRFMSGLSGYSGSGRGFQGGGGVTRRTRRGLPLDMHRKRLNVDERLRRN